MNKKLRSRAKKIIDICSSSTKKVAGALAEDPKADKEDTRNKLVDLGMDAYDRYNTIVHLMNALLEENAHLYNQNSRLSRAMKGRAAPEESDR